MRIIILLTALSITTANAQPVIDRSNFFDIGDSALRYLKFDTSLWSVDPGTIGENITWDLSNVDITHPSVIVDTLLFIDPVGTPFYPSNLGADYSAANLCMLVRTEPFYPENNDYNYYFASEDSLAFIGHWADTGGNEIWEYHHPDPLRELVFPLTYGDQYTDQFTRYYTDQSGSGAHYAEGIYMITVDAYGTLITPEGMELNDVIRVRTVQEVTDSSALGVETTVLHAYKWYSSGAKGAIVTMMMAIGDSTQVETLHYLKQTDISTSISGPSGTNTPLIAHEGNSIVVSLKDGGPIRSLALHDAAGRLVRTIEGGSDRIGFDRNSLESGTYMLVIRTADRKRITGKFTVE